MVCVFYRQYYASMQRVPCISCERVPEIGLLVDFSRGEVSSKRDGLFCSYCTHGMLEGKYYQSTDMMFSFVFAMVDRDG